MQGIGLGQQPYVVIRHRDTPHAHVHIVTTDIRPDGTKIDLWVGRLRRLQLVRVWSRNTGSIPDRSTPARRRMGEATSCTKGCLWRDTTEGDDECRSRGRRSHV
jgi:hypothetical protein